MLICAHVIDSEIKPLNKTVDVHQTARRTCVLLLLSLRFGASGSLVSVLSYVKGSCSETKRILPVLIQRACL